MRRRPLLLLLVLAGCPGGQPVPTVPSNLTAPRAWSPTLALAPSDVVGWLAVAPRRRASDDWTPVDAERAALVVEGEVPAGVTLRAIPARGDAADVRAGARVTIEYGCDDNVLDVQPLVGDASLEPGPVWIVPSELPPGWHPAGVEVRADAPTRERRVWTAGPLALSLVRLDDRRARFEIRAGEVALHAAEHELYFMDGAETFALDLTRDFLPAMPMPAAVFLVAPDGPALVVLVTQGFEGVTLSTLLVGAERAAPVESLSTYLYSCAF